MTNRLAAIAIAAVAGAATTGISGCNLARDHLSGSCGASVRVTGARGQRVTLEIENASDETIEIGGSQEASFVDTHGAAMQPEMDPASDDWFMPFKLPARSHRAVTVRLLGGDPSALDRLEIPNSGGDFVPVCTIEASGLAAEK
jgi:hypothetical protein